MGSFDCVAVRFADGNFAQDDRGLVAVTGVHNVQYNKNRALYRVQRLLPYNCYR